MYIPQQPKTLNDPHGEPRTDQYAWLHRRDSAEVLRFLDSQNGHANRVFHTMRGDVQRLHAEMMHRADRDDISVPVYRDGYYYYRRTERGKNYSIHCRRQTLDSPEQILVDENARAAEHDYYSFGGYTISPDNRIMAITEDVVGRRTYAIHFIDLETGSMQGSIQDTHGNVVWTADSKSIYYSGFDPETLRTNQVFRQPLDGGAARQLIFEEEHTAFTAWTMRSRDKQTLIIYSQSKDATVVHTVPLHERMATPTHLLGDYDVPIQYSVDRLGDYFYVLEQDNRPDKVGAGNGCLWRFASGQERLILLPDRNDTVLQDVELFTRRCAWQESVDGEVRLYHASWEDLIERGYADSRHQIPIPYDVYFAGFEGNATPLSDNIRFHYGSPIYPSRVYELNTRTGGVKHLKTQKIPRYDEREYVTKRVWVPSRDGKTKIPMTVSHHRTVSMNGSAPAMIYGYGSYGVTLDPTFDVTRISLMDRGFVVAVANIRGGGLMGRSWYDAGKKLNKWNTFNDFIDCSEYLIQHKYCSKHKLTAMGGSAGGLLMGVVLNERPDLYQAIIAQVPFVDVLTTMLDDSLPLTTLEYEEWGDPHNKEHYDYMRTYSPYDNIKTQALPHLLVISGYHDSQVQYWEPAKWIAKLREHRTNQNHIVLMMAMSGGHQSQSGLSGRVMETAQTYAFLINAVQSSVMT